MVGARRICRHPECARTVDNLEGSQHPGWQYHQRGDKLQCAPNRNANDAEWKQEQP